MLDPGDCVINLSWSKNLVSIFKTEPGIILFKATVILTPSAMISKIFKAFLLGSCRKVIILEMQWHFVETVIVETKNCMSQNANYENVACSITHLDKIHRDDCHQCKSQDIPHVFGFLPILNSYSDNMVLPIRPMMADIFMNYTINTILKYSSSHHKPKVFLRHANHLSMILLNRSIVILYLDHTNAALKECVFC